MPKTLPASHPMLADASDKRIAVGNIFAYNDALNTVDTLPTIERADLLRTVSMARAWFAVERGGEWYVGPAKYAGFVGMTPTIYADKRLIISGTRGEMVLKRHCANTTGVPKTHPAFMALQELAARFNREPNALAYVYILQDEPAVQAAVTLPLLETATVDLIVACVAALSQAGQDVAKQKIAAI